MSILNIVYPDLINSSLCVLPFMLKNRMINVYGNLMNIGVFKLVIITGCHGEN